MLRPRNTAGPSPPVQSAGQAPGPPLPRSGTGQHPGENAHHSELLLGPVSTWGRALGAFSLAGLLVCSNYLTNGTLNQEPATHRALGWLWKLVCSLKCTPPIVLQIHGLRKPPLGSLSRSWKGLRAVGVQVCAMYWGRCSSKVQEVGSPECRK